MSVNTTRLAVALLAAALIALTGLAAPTPAAVQASKSGPGAPLPAPAADPGDWPMYGHDAQHTSTNLAESLLFPDNINGLVQRWQVHLSNNGSPSASGPIVANGRVYVGTSASNGNNYFAFDAVTGAPLWGANVGYIDTSACFSVGLGSTAAVSGNVLVVGGGDIAYYGLDATTGHQLWRDPWPNVGPSAFAWASPLIANNRAYIGIASDCDNPVVRGEVRAVDLASGALINNQYFVPAGQTGGGIWNSPALSPDGNTLVVTTGEDQTDNQPYTRALVTLDPLTLAIREAAQVGPPHVDYDYADSPLFFHDSLGRVLVGAINKDSNFYAYVPTNLAAGPVWQPHSGYQGGLMPAYDPTHGAGGTLFMANAPKQVYALDPTTGGYRWISESAQTYVFANFAAANGMLFVNQGSAGLDIRDEGDGHILRTLHPANPGTTFTGVVVSHGFIYWVAGNYLNAWSLPVGYPTPTPTLTPTVGPSPTSTPTATSTPVPATPTIGAGCLFSDVCPTDYFFTPVQYLVQRGALSGYNDNTFRPYSYTTRAQLVKVVVLAFGIEAYTPPTPTFSDVPADFPFAPYIEAAVHANLVSGYADGTFRPYDSVTRGQLAKISIAAAGMSLVTPPAATFEDVPLESPFYSFIETAVCVGVLSGYDCGGPGEPCDPSQRPYFRPFGQATRGQVSKIVYTALTNVTTCPTPGPRHK